MSEPKFVARATKVETQNLPAAVDQARQVQTFIKSQVDLDHLDVHDLTQSLIDNYNRNQDTGILASWFGRKKFEGQQKKLAAFNAVVREVREHSRNLQEYKAELLNRQYIFPLIMQGQMFEVKQAIELMREQHKTAMHREDIDRRKTFEQLRTAVLSNDSIDIINQLKRKIVSDIDINNISPHVATLIRDIINPNMSSDQLLNALGQYENIKAESDIRKQEARAAKISTDKMESDYDELRKKRTKRD
ncbi:MAG: hypothetical protein WAW41_02135 [Methylobacter sp.]